MYVASFSPSKLSRLLLRIHNNVRLYLARGPNVGMVMSRLNPRCTNVAVSIYYSKTETLVRINTKHTNNWHYSRILYKYLRERSNPMIYHKDPFSVQCVSVVHNACMCICVCAHVCDTI